MPDLALCKNIPEYILAPCFSLFHLQWHLYGILLLFQKYLPSNLTFLPATGHLSSFFRGWTSEKRIFIWIASAFSPPTCISSPYTLSKKNLSLDSGLLHFLIPPTPFWWILFMFFISLTFSNGKWSMLFYIRTSWRFNSFLYFNQWFQTLCPYSSFLHSSNDPFPVPLVTSTCTFINTLPSCPKTQHIVSSWKIPPTLIFSNSINDTITKPSSKS